MDEEEDEEEGNEVNQLPLNGINQSKANGFGQTYGEVMSEMRKKKWGLNQRITF